MTKNKTTRTRGKIGRAVAVGVAALLIVAAGIFWYQERASAGQLVGGAIVDPPQPAPDFTLTNQFGQPFRISSLRGKPVALTFVYTNCPDVCPLISAHLHRAYELLGSRAGQVAMVAVTVDPEHDTVEQVRSFSDRFGLTQQWSFLTGSRPEVAQVWAAYGIDAQRVQANPGAGAADGRPEAIEHSAPIFMIDGQGLVRAMLPIDVSPENIAADLGLLIARR